MPRPADTKCSPRLQALALYEANWINSTEFHARMDKRAVSLVQSAHADTTAVAQAGQPASAQLEASLVPFRGGQWLMASMTYSCLDENSRMAQRKAHCLRFLQADSTGAAVIQQPPWVSAKASMHPNHLHSPSRGTARVLAPNSTLGEAS